jgi:hypothetical protein
MFKPKIEYKPKRAVSIIGRSRTGFLALLALLIVSVAWAQNHGPTGGPGRLPHAFSAISPAKPAAHPASDQYDFFAIGPADSPYSVADGINNARLVTGYYQDPSFNYHGFVWENGNFQTVDYPGAAYTLLYSVNNLGVAIGYYNDGIVDHVIEYDVRKGACPPRYPGLPAERRVRYQ